MRWMMNCWSLASCFCFYYYELVRLLSLSPCSYLLWECRLWRCVDEKTCCFLRGEVDENVRWGNEIRKRGHCQVCVVTFPSVIDFPSLTMIKSKDVSETKRNSLAVSTGKCCWCGCTLTNAVARGVAHDWNFNYLCSLCVEEHHQQQQKKRERGH